MKNVICKGCGQIGHVRLFCKKTNTSTKENDDDNYMFKGQKRKVSQMNEDIKKMKNFVDIYRDITDSENKNTEYYEVFCKDQISVEGKPILDSSSESALYSLFNATVVSSGTGVKNGQSENTKSAIE